METTLAARTSAELEPATWDLPSVSEPRWRPVRSMVFERDSPPLCRGIRFWVPYPEVHANLDARRDDYRVIDLRFDGEPRSWVVGRSRSCDIVLSTLPHVSRRHALISVRGDVCAVRDLGSTHGISVHGTRVSTAVLEPGDQVCLANVVVAQVN